jgi:predicted CoA-binding protein
MTDMALVRRLLETSRRIAVLGASPRPERDSHRILVYLLEAGYEAIPVRPATREVAGVRCFPDLESAGPVDLVDVFRAPQHLPGIVDDCIRLRLPALWLQLGVVHEESIARARAAGLDVVADRCIMVDHRRLGIPARG